VDALVVSGIDSAGFFWIESEVGKTLTGAHLSGAQDVPCTPFSPDGQEVAR